MDPLEPLCGPVRYVGVTSFQMAQGHNTGGKSRQHTLEDGGGHHPGGIIQQEYC